MSSPAFHAGIALLLLASVGCGSDSEGVFAARPLTLSFQDDGVDVEKIIGAGDVQGDGVDDLVVLMQYYDAAISVEDTAGLGVFVGDDGRPDDTIFSYVQGPSEWLNVARLGDVDGDGRADVAVTSHVDCCTSNEVWVYGGTADGLGDAPRQLDRGDIELESEMSGDGDLDGDGVPDLVVATSADITPGAAVFWGAEGEAALVSSSSGGDVYGLGDVNGDGYADMTVGGAFALVFDVFAGGASGLDPTPLQTLTWEGDAGIFGIAPVGDVDGDGTDEIVVTRPGDDSAPALLYAGSPDGVVLDPIMTLHSPDQPDSFAYTMAAVARDGGVAMLALCDPYIDWDQGAAYLYAPGAEGYVDEPTAVLAGTSEVWLYGNIAADAGDFDHDGVRDLVLGGNIPDSSGGVNRVYFLSEDAGG